MGRRWLQGWVFSRGLTKLARLCPGKPAETTHSSAELRVFELIRERLDDEWIALHSLGLAFHATKPWAEIDFVLIGPPGVFCLEVKGGRVARRDGLWHFTDRNDTTTVKTQGPFEQVGTASAALRHYLLGALPWMRKALFGYGVVMPDISFAEEGPDILPDVLCDDRKVTNWTRYISDLVTYWQQRIPKTSKLDMSERMQVLDELRGDFDLRPSLQKLIGDVSSELLSLTREQYRVLDSLEDNERIIVSGGAGTGKTLLCLQEAERQSRLGKKVFLCCFNRNLAFHLREATSGMPGVVVDHLHGFMAEVIGRAHLYKSVPDVEEADRFLVVFPRLCIEALLELNEYEQFDVLIVDEGQDILLPPYLEVLDILLKGGLNQGTWRIFYDAKQNMFNGSSAPGLDLLLRGAPARYSLSVNCRNTAPIAVTTSLLSGVQLEPTLKSTGPDVETHIYANKGEARRMVGRAINRLLSERIGAEQIVVLSRYRLENSSAASLTGVPFPIATWEGPVRPRSIRFSTVASFKGLESDVVLLVDVDDLESPDGRQSIYVGASRARVLLQVFVHSGQQESLTRTAFEFGKAMREERTNATAT